MNETKNYQNREWLKQQYIGLNITVIDIAKECSVNRKTINYWLRKFNFPKRKKNTWNQGKKYLQVTGENNPNWKGDEVGYHCLHVWVRRYKPQPERCENCGNKQKYLELANISGEYKRDINDYRYLCVRYHKEFDGTLQSFVEGGKNTRFIKGHKTWNKDIPSELQPCFGKKHTKESIEKMKIAMSESWRKRKIGKTSNEVEGTQKTIEVYNN